MKKCCPNCNGKRFIVTTHVVQEWVVDEYGNYDEMIDDCVDITHESDDSDLWECYECGYEAEGRKFNVEE